MTAEQFIQSFIHPLTHPPIHSFVPQNAKVIMS